MLNNHKDPRPVAQACVIWMHGLGADSSDMKGLANQPSLAQLPLHHVFMDAPVRPVTLNNGMRMRAWYDITGFQLTDREDEQGILQSQREIVAVINAQVDAGFHSKQIFLAGFSQGGAMALYTALHCNMSLAGVIALSAYLPIAATCKPLLAKETPIFIGSGQYDQIVLPDWTKQSEQWLLAHGYNQLSSRQYPMEHSICIEELNDIANWLSIHVKGVNVV